MKNFLQKLSPLLVILIISGLVIYLLNSSSHETQNNDKLSGPKSPAQKNTQVPQHFEESEKTRIALQHLKKKSRLPSAGVAIIPEQLKSSDILFGPWKIWSSMTAVKPELTTSEDIIFQKLTNLNIVESTYLRADFHEFDKNLLPVVYDSRLKKAGIVTGLIKIETNRKSELEHDLLALDAVIENSFDQIEVFFVVSQKSIFDLELLYKTLKSKSYVRSIELDISDRNYEKK